MKPLPRNVFSAWLLFAGAWAGFAAQDAPYRPDVADISGWNFTTGTLAALDLTYADFSALTAASTIFSTDVFTQKDLSSANFSGANLTNAAFAFATLSGANLSAANLSGAWLTGADLTNATVSGTNFAGITARGFTQAQFASTWNYKNKDLRDLVLFDNDLTNWDLSGQNLSCTSFMNATLSGVNFTDSNIGGAGFFSASGFTENQLYSTLNYKAKDLSSIEFNSLNMNGWNFSGQSLDHAWMNECTLVGANFSSANLKDINFSGCDLSQADFSDATLSYLRSNSFTNITGANFKGAIDAYNLIRNSKNYIDGNLNGLNLSEADFSCESFFNVNMREVNFNASILESVEFNTVDFSNSTLSYANLTGATLSGVTLSGADLSHTDLTGATLSGVTLSGADLAHTDFTGATLSQVNFAGATLAGTVFTNATLLRSDLSGATSRGLTLEQLYSTRNYEKKYTLGFEQTNFSNNDLRGVQLSNALLSGATFSGANLIGADFSKSTLGCTYFDDANLQNANFTSARVSSGTIFYNADLRGANMASLSGTFTAKNTLSTSGNVMSVRLTSGNVLRVRRYVPSAKDAPMITAKLAANATLQSGARIALEEGGVLEILTGKTLTAQSGAVDMAINPLYQDATQLLLNPDSGLVLDGDTIFTVTLEDILAANPLDYAYTLVRGDPSATFSGLAHLVKDETVFLNYGGKAYEGDWSLSTAGNAVKLSIGGLTRGKTEASWAAEQGLSGDDAAPTVAPQNDGIPNLAKYALGLRGDVPTCYAETGYYKTAQVNGKRVWQYAVSKDAARARVTPVYSLDLKNWSSEGLTVALDHSTDTHDVYNVYAGDLPAVYFKLSVESSE